MKRLIIAAVSSIISTACFASTPSSKLITLTPDNHAVLGEEVTSKSVSEFLKTFLSLEGNRRIVYISSPGGSVVDGMQLIRVIRDEKVANPKLRVVCYVDEAASMAFAIVQTVCDERLGGVTSTLMQHQASYGVNGSDNQVISRVKMISSVLKVLDGLQAERLGISVAELRRRSADEWWTVGQEAIDSKVIDGISSIVCSKELVEQTKDVKFAGFFGSGTAKFSKCPMLTAPIEVILDDGKPANELVKKIFDRIPLSERVIRYK